MFKPFGFNGLDRLGDVSSDIS